MLQKLVRPGKLAVFIGLSLLAHIITLYASGMFGSFEFGAPVNLAAAVSVDLKDIPSQQGAFTDVDKASDSKQRPVMTPAEEQTAGSEPTEEPPNTDSNQPDTVASPTPTVDSKPAPASTKFEPLQPLRLIGEFLGTESETLNYRVSMLGIPIGSAVLQARRDKGDIRITLKVTSDAAISTIYPVDDLIDTRHINGNFIVTRIRQKEGSFIADRGFTLFLREKNVFWIDLLTKKSVNEAIPSSEVVDLLSSLYYLRNRQLQVGKSETLHIYDSDTYSEVPVEVLQRETIRLPDLSEKAAIVIRPKLKTDGIFRRTGDIRIWLSDDEYRVPVRFVTSIAMGQVTAELVSSESKRSQVQMPDMKR